MEPEKKSSGALVGLVIIIIILLIGGIYIWQNNKGKLENKTPGNSSPVTEQDSAELNTLDQDLSTTNIDVGASAVNSVQ